tara:strand:- start:1871 stop:2620 length:750 start_codon:yes stop_codon:yes gene_type:complete
MGFLNHSTNNIIVDAVLTDKGREQLSVNGRLDIRKFGLFDDEVDYTTIKKYGPIIGKEKIEKTTPVFEAITGQNVSLKYPLRTFSSNSTTRINRYPFLLKVNPTTEIVLTYSDESINTNNNTNTTTINVKTMLNNVSTNYNLESVLQDNFFRVSFFNKLLGTTSAFTNQVTFGDVTTFDISTTQQDSFETVEFIGQKRGSFEITIVGVITDDSFKQYSVYNNTNQIHTQITITGTNSGASLVLPVTINR